MRAAASSTGAREQRVAVCRGGSGSAQPYLLAFASMRRMKASSCLCRVHGRDRPRQGAKRVRAGAASHHSQPPYTHTHAHSCHGRTTHTQAIPAVARAAG
jgi:hypothetical protein